MININLLPENVRENIAYSKKNKKVVSYLRMLIIFCLLFASSFILLFIFLTTNNQFFISKIKENEKIIADYQPFFSEAKELEEKIKVITKVKKNYQYWSKFNYTIGNLTPQGVSLTSIKIDDANTILKNVSQGNTVGDRKININGYAQTKNDIGAFRDALAKQEGFKMVNVNTVKEEADEVTKKIRNNFSISLVMEKSVVLKEDK